jgi:formamidopyrimidine-DNA glycosylase
VSDTVFVKGGLCAGSVPIRPQAGRGAPSAPARKYADAMPELPEVEAWVRELDPHVGRTPIASARPGHVATLKTFDPRPEALEGRTFGGARRRGKNLLFPTADDELVLRVHLMSAGRLRYLAAGKKRPARPMFEVGFGDGGALVLTEAGKKKRAGVWLVTPDRLDEDLAHLGPDALDVDRATLAEILGRERRQLHPLLRDQRALAGIGRAHANEILWEARLSPFRLSTDLDEDEIEVLATAIHDDLSRALELRVAGKGDAAVYRVHGRFGEPCPRCGETLHRVDFEEHTITYCPAEQTGGRILKDRRLSRLLR